jgi:drug/metabolite transporter (DMT)-like permease
MKAMTNFSAGISAAFASALFLGLAPVFGKLAIRLGLHPLFVVALRTCLAALLLLLFMALFRRQFLFIYPAGLLGCLIAGWINGIGSLLYYSALGRIDASLGQVIYSLYPIFVALWAWLDHQRPSNLTFVRLGLVIPALALLTQAGRGDVDMVGVLMMLVSSVLYALHLPINQRVLFDMPAPTVTVYTLLAMSAATVPALFFVTFASPPAAESWLALFGLTSVTFFSRLALFLGVKHLGGVQTAILGLGELLVTILFSHLMLQESLTFIQWLGIGLLVISLTLTIFDKTPKRRPTSGGWLGWLRPPGLPSDLS